MKKIIFSLMAFAFLTGFVISGFDGKETAFGDYPSGFVWGDATLENAQNEYVDFEEDGYAPEVIPDDDGIAKLINASLGEEGAAAIAIKTAPGTPHAITECSGISFQYKSNATVQFAAEMKNNSSGQYILNLETKDDLDGITIVMFGDLEPEYGTPPAFDLEDVFQITWSLKAGVSGTNVDKLNLELSNVECITDDDNSSSSDGDSSSSSEPPPSEGPVMGYYIFEYKPNAANNYPTAYDEVEKDKYLFGYSFDPEENFTNPTVSGEVVWVDQGVGKLREATFGAAPSNGNSYRSQGAALGIKNNPSGISPNLSDCEAISYYYKGETHSFNVDFSGTECNGTTAKGDGSNKWGVETIATSSIWAQKTVHKSDLKLYNTWDASICGTGTDQVNPPVDLSKATQIVWELGNKKSPNKTVSLMITNVVCLDGSDEEVNIDTPDESITVNTGKLGTSSSSSSNTTTISSSSVTTVSTSSSSNTNVGGGSSSSSSNTNASGGSSSSGGTGNSGEWYCIYAELRLCSSGHPSDYTCPSGGLISSTCPAGYDGNTPIILSHQAHSNTLSVMQNAVNLQVMGNATVQIFDLKGNAVRTLSFAQGNYIVPLSDLPRGLYIVKASNASWRQTVKATVK